MYRTYLQEVKRVNILTFSTGCVLRRSGNPLLILRLGELRYCRSITGRIATSAPPPSPPLGSGPYHRRGRSGAACFERVRRREKQWGCR